MFDSSFLEWELVGFKGGEGTKNGIHTLEAAKKRHSGCIKKGLLSKARGQMSRIRFNERAQLIFLQLGISERADVMSRVSNSSEATPTGCGFCPIYYLKGRNMRLQ